MVIGHTPRTGVPRVEADDASTRLEELGWRLGRVGLCARLDMPLGKPPSLHVVNPAIPTAEERVMIDWRRGEAWFWWAWAERIAPADDLDRATAAVCRVLGVPESG
jgi:hypothetical protein